MRAFIVLLGCVGLVTGLVARVEAQAQAQAPSAEPPPAAAAPAQTSEYDDLVLRALAAYDAGHWDEARRLFERAHGIDPTARTLRTIGMAAFNQRDFVAALQNLEAALLDPRKPLTDEQREHVQGLIDSANREVGRFRLHLQPSTASLTVDGKSPTLVGKDELVLLPGRHELRASAEGYAPYTRSLDVQAQDRAPLELSLEAGVGANASDAMPKAAPLAPETPEHPPAAAEATKEGSGHTLLGVSVLSLGAAGLIVSGVTLGLALHDKSELDGQCPERRCPYSEHATLDRYNAMRLVSGLTLGAGLVATVSGLILLFGTGDPEAEHASVQPLLAPGFVGVRGQL
ncbi:MAG: hypothetical protein ACHQ53_17670 [Polyangiales bacterium]